MSRTMEAVTDALRDAVPFLVITVVWVVVMLVLYGLFLLSKPGDISYGPWVHTSVFVPGLLGFVAHLVHEVRKTG